MDFVVGRFIRILGDSTGIKIITQALSVFVVVEFTSAVGVNFFVRHLSYADLL